MLVFTAVTTSAPARCCGRGRLDFHWQRTSVVFTDVEVQSMKDGQPVFIISGFALSHCKYLTKTTILTQNICLTSNPSVYFVVFTLKIRQIIWKSNLFLDSLHLFQAYFHFKYKNEPVGYVLLLQTKNWQFFLLISSENGLETSENCLRVWHLQCMCVQVKTGPEVWCECDQNFVSSRLCLRTRDDLVLKLLPSHSSLSLSPPLQLVSRWPDMER